MIKKITWLITWFFAGVVAFAVFVVVHYIISPPPARAQAPTDLSVLQTIYAAVTSAIPAGSNVIGAIFGAPNVTPASCSINLTAGGTAQNIIAANAAVHGFTIANGDASAGGGEPVWMSFTSGAVVGGVDSYPLAAPTASTYAGLVSYTTPVGFGSNHAVSVVAATAGHQITCTQW
jgi:hypothetical protein